MPMAFAKVCNSAKLLNLKESKNTFLSNLLFDNFHRLSANKRSSANFVLMSRPNGRGLNDLGLNPSWALERDKL